MFDRKRFNSLMKKCGFSVPQISEITGISQSSVGAYSGGRIDIPASKLSALADVLGCSTDYLLGRDDSDITKWADKRNADGRTKIEGEYAGQPVSKLKLSTEQETLSKNTKALPPLAVWPYNLIEVVGGVAEYNNSKDVEALIEFYDSIRIPLSKDQEAGLDAALDMLTEREKDVLLKHYRDLFTLEEIASELKVTRERARQVEAKAVRKLRHPSRWILIRDGLAGNGLNDRDKELEKRRAELAEKGRDLDALRLEVAQKQKAFKEEAAGTELTDEQAERAVEDFRKHREGLDAPIDNIDLSIRSYNVLKRAGISTLGELVDYITLKGPEWTKIRNLGKKSEEEITGVLSDYAGLTPDGIIRDTFLSPDSDYTIWVKLRDKQSYTTLEHRIDPILSAGVTDTGVRFPWEKHSHRAAIYLLDDKKVKWKYIHNTGVEVYTNLVDLIGKANVSIKKG